MGSKKKNKRRNDHEEATAHDDVADVQEMHEEGKLHEAMEDDSRTPVMNDEAEVKKGGEVEQASSGYKLPPVEVLYCAVCTFPVEMCEFSGMYEKCQPWLREHAPEFADAVECGRKRRVLTEKDRLEAMVEGKGSKKAVERAVVLETSRIKSTTATFITGMDLFGYNLKDLCKEFRKKFSCGGGVHAPEEGRQLSSIQIQGNVETQLADLLVAKYKIPKEAIFVLRNKKKVPVFDAGEG